MSFLGIIKLGENLVFYAQTSTPATGAETDADAVPSYRVYSEDTDAPILTGNMVLLDDANTVGWYVKKIAVTTAAGFEANKTYGVRKRALMATVPGADFDTFRVTTRDMDDLAQPGDEMDFVNAPNAVAVAAIQAGLAVPGSAMNTTQWGGVAVGGMPNSTTPPTVGQVADAVYDEMLAGHVLPGSGAEAWANSGGAVVGSKEFVYTVTALGVPLEGVQVAVSTDTARANVIRVGYTNAFGNVTFWLVPGTYYFWRAYHGYSGTEPDVEVVIA